MQICIIDCHTCSRQQFRYSFKLSEALCPNLVLRGPHFRDLHRVEQSQNSVGGGRTIGIIILASACLFLLHKK